MQTTPINTANTSGSTQNMFLKLANGLPRTWEASSMDLRRSCNLTATIKKSFCFSKNLQALLCVNSKQVVCVGRGGSKLERNPPHTQNMVIMREKACEHTPTCASNNCYLACHSFGFRIVWLQPFGRPCQFLCLPCLKISTTLAPRCFPCQSPAL